MYLLSVVTASTVLVLNALLKGKTSIVTSITRGEWYLSTFPVFALSFLNQSHKPVPLTRSLTCCLHLLKCD